jgi:ABC-2 type transport system permease protein
MTIGGVLAGAGVECSKLTAQFKVRLALAACATGPFAFAVAMRVQRNAPTDTLFGRAVAESGFAVPLVILGFAALWVLPALASLVGGDLFSSEDRFGTWTTVLTRSRSRAEMFGGNALTALAFSAIAVATLAISSVVAGALVIGRQPLIDLSGVSRTTPEATVRIALAWMSVLPPTFAVSAAAVLVSVATRSSAAGIGLPVVAGLAMQVYAFVDGPEVVRRLLMTTAFDAWHGLLSEPAYFKPLAYGTAVSGRYVIACLGAAYGLMRRRDIGR